jgi:hypothetical protein
MALGKERFDQKKVDKILHHLQCYHDKGQPIDYEILVDGFKAVLRTNRIDMFSIYENHVDADTKTIEFLLFSGNSNFNSKYIFYFGDEPTDDGEMSGKKLNKKVREEVQRKLTEGKYEELEKQNQELQGVIKKLEKEIESLKGENETLEAKQSPLNSVFGNIGSSLIETFIRRNPKLMHSIPGGEALAGLIEGNDKPQHAGQTEESEVSFQSKSEGTSLSEDDQASIRFVQELKSQFTKDEFDKIVFIIQGFGVDKSKIDRILIQVNQ